MSFPGSFWTNNGYVSPIEAGNFVSTYSVEQGFTLLKAGRHAVVPYAGMTASVDGQGFAWNNRTVSHAGVRYQIAFANGIVQAGGGYAYERRFNGDPGAGHPTAFVNYWVGWNPAINRRSARDVWSSLPGTSWATVGNQAPAEGNNVIGTLYVQQGVTVATFGRVSIVPFLEANLTVDSARKPWNNRRVLGEGLKFRAAVPGGVIEASAVYKHERRWLDGRQADGLTAAVNLWLGWNPSHVDARE